MSRQGHSLLAMVLTIVGAMPMVANSGEPTAEELMVRAHDARAVWQDFPGFTADVTISINGEPQAGWLTVTPDGKVKLEDVPESPQRSWAQDQLQSLVGHRQPASTREYDVAFADKTTTHPLGRLIKINDDPMDSVYRIRGDEITEVHRNMGKVRFIISVIETTRNPQGKYLPRTYSVSFWDAKSNQLTRSDVFQDEWTRAGDFDLPKRILNISTTGDGERIVRAIEFKNVRLAEAEAAK